MAYNTSEFTKRGEGIIAWLENEYASIRTGRATPALLDSVQVESYGARVPLQQVGSLSVEDAKTIRISIWDQSGIKNVEKALMEADLGISVVADSSGLRAIFPELTSERRVQLLKLAKTKLEDARISIRTAREDAIKEMDRLLQEGEMSKDEKFSAKEDLQKKVDMFNTKLGDLLMLKEKEISL